MSILNFIESAFLDDNIFYVLCEKDQFFIEQFCGLVECVKSLKVDMSNGKYMPTVDHDYELKRFKKTTEKFLLSVTKLHQEIKGTIDREFISSEPEKSRNTHYVTHLESELNKLIKYCDLAKRGDGKRHEDDFKMCEVMLAQEYQNTGRKLSTYDYGEFADILYFFHQCCDIPEYKAPDGSVLSFDSSYIDRIKRQANRPFKECWHITPQINFMVCH